jgi:hypothetical protein
VAPPAAAPVIDSFNHLGARCSLAVLDVILLGRFSPGHIFGAKFSRFSLNGQLLFGSRRFRVTFQRPETFFYPGQLAPGHPPTKKLLQSWSTDAPHAPGRPTPFFQGRSVLALDSVASIILGCLLNGHIEGAARIDSGAPSQGYS